MGYHDNHWKKNKVTLQRRVTIQNLSNLTKKLSLMAQTFIDSGRNDQIYRLYLFPLNQPIFFLSNLII